MERIGPSAFNGCRSLERIQLPKTLKKINESAFYECSSLKTIWLPEGLEEIGQSAFYKCTSLEIITLPSTLKYLVEKAFAGCAKLMTFIAKPADVFMYGYALGYDTNLELIPGVVVYCSSGTSIANWVDDKGISRAPLETAPKDPSENFVIDDGSGDDISPAPIVKKANPLSVKAKKTYTVKYKTLKKKNQTIKISKLVTFKNKGQGTLTYTMKTKNKKITVNKKTGKFTLKKGLKKKTYKIKINIKAAGNSTYKAATKSVTVKIKVK